MVITLVAFGVLVGWVMERITRGLGDVPEAVVVVATVGILLGIDGLLFLQYGAVSRNFPAFLPVSGFTVSGVNVTWAQVISVIIATASAAGLYLFLRRSRLGVAMRAVVDNPTLVALSGENPARVRQAAAAALGELGPVARDAVADLNLALHDSDANVRRAATDALLRITAGGQP